MHSARQPIQFSPRLVPTLAAMAMFALTLYLAIWQQGRAAEKRALQAEFVQRVAAQPVMLSSATRDGITLHYRQVIAHGEWDIAGQIFLDNKTDDAGNGQAGYHVITPLKLARTTELSRSGAAVEDGLHLDTFVLVNRGWIARSAAYPVPPIVSAPAGKIDVVGVSTLPNTRFLELSDAAIQGPVWQNLTIARYRTATQRDVLPIIVLASQTKPDSLQALRPLTEKPDARVEKHIEYMLTWYSLAATVLALWIGLNIRRTPVNL